MAASLPPLTHGISRFCGYRRERLFRRRACLCSVVLAARQALPVIAFFIVGELIHCPILYYVAVAPIHASSINRFAPIVKQQYQLSIFALWIWFHQPQQTATKTRFKSLPSQFDGLYALSLVLAKILAEFGYVPQGITTKFRKENDSQTVHSRM